MTLEQLKEICEGKTLVELATLMSSIKADLEAAAVIKTGIQKQFDYLAFGLIPEMMDDEGIETLKITDVGRLQVTSDIRCACPAGNREKLAEWLRDHKHGALVQGTVNSSSLKAFVKEMIKEDGEYPKELLKIEAFSRASVVKA